MRYGALAFFAVALAAPGADAQGLWWVEGDRYCNDFLNRSRNGAMCGNPKKGESEPKPTFRYDFNFPRPPAIEGDKSQTVPAPADRPGVAAPARGTRPRPAVRQ